MPTLAEKRKNLTAPKYTVGYKPDPFTKYDYVLATFDNEPDAVEAAIGYSKTYYGECSAITVRNGRKKVYATQRRIRGLWG